MANPYYDAYSAFDKSRPQKIGGAFQPTIELAYSQAGKGGGISASRDFASNTDTFTTTTPEKSSSISVKGGMGYDLEKINPFLKMGLDQDAAVKLLDFHKGDLNKAMQMIQSFNGDISKVKEQLGFK